MRLPGKVALITGAAAGIPGELMGFGGATAWLTLSRLAEQRARLPLVRYWATQTLRRIVAGAERSGREQSR